MYADACVNPKGHIASDRSGTAYCIFCGLIFWEARKKKRKGTPKATPTLRQKLAQRDGCMCFYCGHELLLIYSHTENGALPKWAATVDHLIPRCRGGSNDLRNLVLACAGCNQAKADLTVEQWRQAGFPKRRSIAEGTYIPVERRLA